MGVATGLQSRLAIGEESTYGTAVAPTRAYPLLSESLELKKNIIQSNAMFPGGYHTRASVRRVESSRGVEGDIKVEATTRGMGLLLKHIMCAAATISPTELDTGVYEYEFPLGLSLGDSLTIQEQFYDMGGTIVQAFDYPGAKFTGAEFTISTDGFLEVTANVDARNEVKQGSPTAVSYGTYKPFKFKDATIKKDGDALASTSIVKSMSITLDRPMDTDRRGIGNQGLKAEPPENDFANITGNMEAEFADPAEWYDDFAADTAMELVLLFEGATIASTYKETLEFTMPAVKLDGTSPKIDGPGIIATPIPFTVGWDGTNPDMTIRYVTADSAA